MSLVNRKMEKNPSMKCTRTPILLVQPFTVKKKNIKIRNSCKHVIPRQQSSKLETIHRYIQKWRFLFANRDFVVKSVGTSVHCEAST